MALDYFHIHKGLNIQNNIYLVYGTVDPSSSGFVAPIGSIYGRTTNGEIWHKTGSGDTAWNMLVDSAGASVEDGYQNTFMGKTGVGSETPTYSSTNVVTSTDSLETAIGDLDAEIGAAVTPETRTNNPTSDQAINLNIDALDSCIGTDAQHASTVYTTVDNSINQKISALDAALSNKSPKQLTADNQDLSLGVAVDSVAVATYSTCEWLLTLKSNSTPANRYCAKIIALNDGTITNIDYTIHAVLTVGSAISGLSVAVTGSSGNMELEVTASENVDYDVSRIYQG